MGRRSSVHGDFLQVKTAMGLERFEDGNSRTASTSLSDLTFLNLEKIDASFHSCSTLAITRVASTLVRVNHFYSLSVNSFGYNSAYPPSCRPPFSYIAVGGGGVSKKVASNLLKIGQLVAYG